PGPQDAEDTLSELEDVDPAVEEPEVQETGPAAEEQPTAVIGTERREPLTDEPEAEDPEVVEPEVEPSTAQDASDQAEVVQESPVSEPEAASEVEREELSLAEERSSEQFFDKEGEHSDSRIFRASRFLRRRE
ncbi:MAG: hypothetical protein M3Y38_08095, partial [Actinomycetota bacterium]|nr:hypothetical protein [Actinomycetota bacterium]